MGAYEHRGEMKGADSETLNLGMSYPGSAAPPGAQSGAALLGSDAACTDALLAILSSAAPPATWNAVSYADWLTVQLGSGAACPDGLMPLLGSGAATPIAPRNAAACPEVFPAHFGSTLPPASRSGAPRTGMLTAHLGSGMSSASWNSVAACPGSGAPPAVVNGVAYTSGLSAVTTASEDAAGYAIDVHEGVAGLDFGHLNPTGIAAAATGQDGGYDDRSGLPLPFANKVVDDVDWDQDELAGAAAERARGAVLGRLGLGVTALGVAGITAGGTAATPATALGLFVMLIAGVTLVNVRVFRA